MHTATPGEFLMGCLRFALGVVAWWHFEVSGLTVPDRGFAEMADT